MTLGKSNSSRLRELLFGQTVPVDMIGVCVVLVGSSLGYYLTSSESLRFLISVPLLFFLPGYVLVGTLYPRSGRPSDESQRGISRPLAAVRNQDRITLPERAALSFGLSVALVPFFGFLLELLPVAAFDGTTFPTLITFVLIGTLIASVRRLRTPTNERFSLPLESMFAAMSAPFTGSMPRAERLATIALAAAVLLAVISVGYVFAVPQQGEQFTDLRVMTESPDGELTLGNYPDEISVDNETELIIGIDNREGQRQEYTVVVTTEQVLDENGSVTAIETSEISRFDATLANGERLRRPQTLDFGSTGVFRVNYDLYVGDPPAEPDADSAYRHTHLTISVVNEETTVTAGEPTVGNESESNSSGNSESVENESESDDSSESEPVENESESDDSSESEPIENESESDDSSESEPIENESESDDSSESEPIENESESDDSSESESVENESESDDSSESEPIENESESDDSSESEPIENESESDDSSSPGSVGTGLVSSSTTGVIPVGNRV